MPNALVTEVSERGALEACRGLAVAGCTVAGVAHTRLAPGHWSRAVELRLRLPNPRQDEQAFVEGLARAASRGDVLLPGGEASLLAISGRRDLFSGVLHGLPPEAVVRRALDKVEFLELAEACDLAPPESAVCTTPAEALSAARRIGYPVAIKPPSSIVRTPDGMRQQGIAVVAEADELAAAVEASAVPYVVQQFERRAVRLSCAGVRAEGELRAVAVARYLRMWPPHAGAASCAETVAPPPKLVSRVEAVLEAVGWEGIFELEVLELPGARFAAIDLNPRPFGWMALARQAGANLAAIWCDALRGRLAGRVIARAGFAYRWEDAEFLHLIRAIRAGRVRQAGQLLRPRRGTVHGYGRLADPAPLVGRMLDALVRNVGR